MVFLWSLTLKQSKPWFFKDAVANILNIKSKEYTSPLPKVQVKRCKAKSWQFPPKMYGIQIFQSETRCPGENEVLLLFVSLCSNSPMKTSQIRWLSRCMSRSCWIGIMCVLLITQLFKLVGRLDPEYRSLIGLTKPAGWLTLLQLTVLSRSAIVV